MEKKSTDPVSLFQEINNEQGTMQASSNTIPSVITRVLSSSTLTSRMSTMKENNDPKRHKSCTTVSPFQTRALTDITNVVGYAPAHHLQNQTQSNIRPDTHGKTFTDLLDDGLVENIISYSSDVPLDVCINSTNIETMQPIVSNSINYIDDELIGREKRKRAYTSRKKCVVDQNNCNAIDIDKLKRPYKRKSNILNINKYTNAVDSVRSSTSHPIESSISNVPVIVRPYVPRKNVSRRSSRTSNATDNVALILG
ncbi:hypothetical protein CASFOL_029805 [Castilleja foliolosa]|uniref:Uncharacterized protein n=1 Tax=Castilleja foliolosa TaxID=1961234 RepID=A0ABD3C8Z1_9LAMI